MSCVDVVIPSVGRPSLAALLDGLAEQRFGGRVLVVDDRPRGGHLTPGHTTASLDLLVLRGRARGPAAARNVGWRASSAEWIAFVDDDVLLGPSWVRSLASDLRVDADVAASQGNISVPLPRGRRPTDWERNVAGLEIARWATADMAYRRAALRDLGGFDERFPHAYREDADLGLRAVRAGWRIVSGQRAVVHPPRPASWHVSVVAQRGNGADALMRRLHGPSWRHQAGVRPGAFRRHVLATAAAVTAIIAALVNARRVAAVAAAAWAAMTASFAWRRIAPGPRHAAEVTAMTMTSVAIPPFAVAHRLRGELRCRRTPTAPPREVQAVLFDRDGTLVHDVPYNGDPHRVDPVPGARAALDRLRAAGLPIGLITNQSGVARGLISADDVGRVNRHLEQLLGSFDAVAVCLHGADDRCGCRKPRPGMIIDVAARLGVDPARCVVVGDIGADIDAATAAGARGILVPTAVTRRDEIADALEVAGDLETAVDMVLGC